MADSVGDNSPHLIITMTRSVRAVTCSQVVAGLADAVGGSRARLIIATRRSIRAVTRSQVVGKSASQPGTDNLSLADKYTEQAPLTSLPEHGSADI